MTPLNKIPGAATDKKCCKSIRLFYNISRFLTRPKLQL